MLKFVLVTHLGSLFVVHIVFMLLLNFFVKVTMMITKISLEIHAFSHAYLLSHSYAKRNFGCNAWICKNQPVLEDIFCIFLLRDLQEPACSRGYLLYFLITRLYYALC